MQQEGEIINDVENASHYVDIERDRCGGQTVINISNVSDEGGERGAVAENEDEGGESTNNNKRSNANHHDSIMRRWKLQAFVQMHLHNDSHYFYRAFYDMLSVPLIVLTTASSIIIFASKENYIRYIVASMTICATILAGMITHFQPAKKAQQHSMLSQRYRIMSHSLESMMKTPDHDREDTKAFMKNIQAELDVLVMSQVDPPGYVIRKQRQIFGPINAILYGEDVVAALINNVKTRNMISVINQRSKKIPRSWRKNAGNVFEQMMMGTNDPGIAQRGGGAERLESSIVEETDNLRMQERKKEKTDEQDATESIHHWVS